MLNIFKYIDYAMKARQGVNAPDELLADTSFGLVEGFFIISFIILGLLSGGSLYLGFGLGYVFFKAFGIILLLILFVDIMVFRMVKRAVGRISKRVTNAVKKGIKHQTIDIEATEVK